MAVKLDRYLACQLVPATIVPCDGAKLATSANTLILSTLYGLLPLERVIEPYELRMGQPGSITSAALLDQARRLGAGQHDQVIVLGGRAYTSAALAVWPRRQHPWPDCEGWATSCRPSPSSPASHACSPKASGPLCPFEVHPNPATAARGREQGRPTVGGSPALERVRTRADGC